MRATNPGPWLDGRAGRGRGDRRRPARSRPGARHVARRARRAIASRRSWRWTASRVEERNVLLHGGDAADRGGEICACFGVSTAARDGGDRQGRHFARCHRCRHAAPAPIAARAVPNCARCCVPRASEEGRVMQTFPLFMSLQGRRALVVGGTEAAARKVELLLSAGAQRDADRRHGRRRDRPADRRGPHLVGGPRLRRRRSRRRVAGRSSRATTRRCRRASRSPPSSAACR